MTKQHEDEAFEAYANGVDTERGVPTERSDTADTEPCPPPVQKVGVAGRHPHDPPPGYTHVYFSPEYLSYAKREFAAMRQEQLDFNWGIRPPSPLEARLDGHLDGLSEGVAERNAERNAWIKRQADEAVPAPKSESSKRKDAPVFSGFLRYFPLAIREAARLSKLGKSSDHGDCLVRHQLEFDQFDPSYPGEDVYHAVAVFWRAGAQLETLLEAKKGAK
jgi:hypothetical protein